MSKICKLIEAENPMMRVRLSGCSSDLDRNDVEEKLFDSMKHYNGIGLSANQIGIMERVFVMYSDVKKRETITCFNPKIVTQSDTKILMDEGCLTYPGLWLKVKRPDGIEVEYEDKKLHQNFCNFAKFRLSSEIMTIFDKKAHFASLQFHQHKLLV